MQHKGHIFNAGFYTTEDYRMQWEEWLNNEFFPFVERKIPSTEHEVFEVMSEANQGMLVFSVQIRCATTEDLTLLQKESGRVFDDFRSRFGERVTNFNTVLNKID